MPQVPELSVLLPVRNAETTLSDALASVARQTDRDFECLILDDGSVDGSREIAEQKSRKDPRFRVLESPGLGIVDTLNLGIERARGRYLARMDADDWMHADRLRIQRQLLDSHPTWAGIGCHVRIFPRNGLGDGMRRYEAWLNGMRTAEDVRSEAYVECPVAHPGLVLRREPARTFGYRDLAWPEDYDLVLRMLAAGREIGMAPSRLLGWRHSECRLSRRDPRYSLAAFTACKAHHLAGGFLKDALGYTLWGHGPTGRSLARALADLGKRIDRIVEVHPRRIGERIAGAAVISPDALGPPDGSRLLTAVSGGQARGQIRRHLAELGYVDGVDYLCAA